MSSPPLATPLGGIHYNLLCVSACMLFSSAGRLPCNALLSISLRNGLTPGPVSTGMGDRMRGSMDQLLSVNSDSGQLSLLRATEMSMGGFRAE